MAPAPGVTEQKLTKAQRMAQRQEKIKLLREQEAKRKRRTIIFVTLAVVVVVALLAFIVVKAVLADKDPSRPEVKNVTADYGIAVTPEGAASAEVNADVPLVQIVEDPTCPHCVDVHDATLKAVSKHVVAGDVQFEWQPVAIGPIGAEWVEQGELGVASEFFVATYAPEDFEAYHNALMDKETGLFAQIQNAATNGGQAPGVKEIAAIAEQSGVKSGLVDRMKKEIGKRPWKNYLKDGLKHFREAGNTGTPTVYLNGKKVDPEQYGPDMSGWLDDVASGKVK